MPKNFTKTTKKSSLALRFIIIIFIVMTVLIGVLLFSLTKILERQTENSYYELANEIVAGRSKEVEQWLAVYENALKVYSENDIVKTGDPALVIDWLHNHQNLRHPDYDYMFFCDAEGTSYRDTGLVGGKGALTERDYYQAMMRQGLETYIGNMVVSKTSGQKVLPVVRAARDADGKTFGFFCGMLGFSQLEEEISTFQIGETGYFYVADHSNTVIAHKYSDRIGTDLMDIPRINDYVRNQVPGHAKMQLNGQSYFMFVTPVNHYNFTIGYEVSQDQVFESVHSVQTMVTVVGVIIGIVIFLIVTFLLHSMTSKIKNLTNVIENLATKEADLTVRLDIDRLDEIGQLMFAFDKFLERFDDMMIVIKQAEEKLKVADGDLANEVDNTTSTINQIAGNISLVNTQVMNQATNIDNSVASISQIKQSIDSMEHMVQGQASSVVEASAAVEEMIGNINSVDKSVVKMSNEFDTLESDTRNGIEQNSAVNNLVQRIAEQSTSMVDANLIIQSIAEQTNLLAMNAAIEAAHAGEAGKGFSVVADEIRKLAEDSAEQSSKIGQELTNIQAGISQVVAASAQSEKSFQAVSGRINLTGELISQIRGAMEEQQSGSHQILDALQAMNENTSRVREASSEMTVSGDAILKDVTELKESMHNIENAVNEINTGTSFVEKSTKQLRNIAQTLTGAIQEIGDDVDLFKV